MREATLVFLIKKTDNAISEICLAMKKRGFGVNRWNGVGGKVQANEAIEIAAIREAQEEINVLVQGLTKVAELFFYFPHQSEWDQRVHVFFCESWQDEPTESEEMDPKWFSPEALPFEQMWPDDPLWLPHVLNGQHLKASFVFGVGDMVLDQHIQIIDRW